MAWPIPLIDQCITRAPESPILPLRAKRSTNPKADQARARRTIELHRNMLCGADSVCSSARTVDRAVLAATRQRLSGRMLMHDSAVVGVANVRVHESRRDQRDAHAEGLELAAQTPPATAASMSPSRVTSHAMSRTSPFRGARLAAPSWNFWMRPGAPHFAAEGAAFVLTATGSR